jgi:acyl-CoA thioester hydrolase
MDGDFEFKETVRIYDTDAEGVVNYAGYYRFFSDALEQFAYEKLGKAFPIMNDRFFFVVVESHARYYKSARLGDVLNISISPELLSEKAVKFNFLIKRDAELICEGYITQVMIDKNKWKTVELPQEVKNKIFHAKS